MNNLKIFVTHYTPLTERKKNIEKQLNMLSVDYEFIEEFDREKLTREHLKLFNCRKLNLSIISLLMKHIQAYRKIIDSNYKYNLILEDDAILDTKFMESLEKGLNQLPENYDMLFIGDGGGIHINDYRLNIEDRSEIQENKFIYKKSIMPSRSWGGVTRCTDSYLISKKCVKNIMHYISQLGPMSICDPADWWLNRVAQILNLEGYWLEPTIVTQGSVNGTYTSSLR